MPSKTRPEFEPLRNKPYFLDFHPSELIYPLDEQHQLPVPWKTASMAFGWLLWLAFLGGPQGGYIGPWVVVICEIHFFGGFRSWFLWQPKSQNEFIQKRKLNPESWKCWIFFRRLLFFLLFFPCGCPCLPPPELPELFGASEACHVLGGFDMWGQPNGEIVIMES